MPFDLPSRIYEKIMPITESGRWLWMGSLLTSGGYAQANSGVHAIPMRVHRFTYETLKGEIPEGLHLDHLCRVPACVNPNHLEPVTCAVNLARGLINQHKHKTHCKDGHELSGVNLAIVNVGDTGRTRRRCKICKAESARRNR